MPGLPMINLLLNLSANGMAWFAEDVLSIVAECTNFLFAAALERLNSTTVLNILCQLLQEVQRKGALGRTT
jgi:hypothetical protein